MIRHFMWIAVASILGLGMMFYPFWPGPYDRMAVPLSGMVQVLGFAGLLLVPVGVAWLILEVVNRRRRTGTSARTEKPLVRSKRHGRIACCGRRCDARVNAGGACARSHGPGPLCTRFLDGRARSPSAQVGCALRRQPGEQAFR